MHSRQWKEFEKTLLFRKTKLFLKRIAGIEPWLSVETAVNLKNYPDWVLCPDLVNPGSVVYSLGVGESIDFDLAVIKELDARVYAFDPTPGTAEYLSGRQLPDRFHFYPLAVSGRDGEMVLYPRLKRDGTLSENMFTLIAENEVVLKHGVRVPAFSLKTLMTKLNHDVIDILKMDIEGAEYEVIENMLASALRPVQILVEFHTDFPGVGREETLRSVHQLNKAGYLIADISVTGREVLFIRQDCIKSPACPHKD